MPPVVFRPELVQATVFIATGAIVLGDVTIGEHSSVWFNAVLRGDSEAICIGRRTNIQDGCILHADPGFPCTIGNGVTVGHGAIVHGATVENDVLVGMRAALMNGVRVGTGSIIGTGAVVTEGTQIPPGSLVLGMPGRVVRPVTPEELTRLRSAAARYSERAKQYQATA